jgi:hypothetical protein
MKAPFEQVFVDGQTTQARPGDRFIYDQRNGTLQIFRPDGDISFQVEGALGPVEKCFVGTHWSAAMTEASAELYARMGGLRGQVARVQGSFPTLITFELIA